MEKTHLRAIAIDDEPLALNIVDTFCQRMGNIEIKTFTHASEGLAAVRIERPDVLLLEINLGTDNGIELARSVPEDTCIIFTTAFTEYAIDAFNLDAIDYLLKPFSYERFQTAINKVVRRQQQELQPTITVKVGYKTVVLPLSDIIYLAAMDNYVRLHLTNGQKLVTQTTLSTLAAQLPESLFVRVHKSFIISRQQIESYSRQQVFLHGEPHPIPIGRTYSAAFSKP